jgi:hypothetical protein
MRHLAFAFIALVTAAAARGDDQQLLTNNPAKPNVVIVLDTSGSMVGTVDVDQASMPASLDDPDSKIATAKRVIREVLNNVGGINFGFTHFRQLPMKANNVGGMGGSPAFKSWLYKADALASGAPNPWNCADPSQAPVCQGAPLQLGPYTPFGARGCSQKFVYPAGCGPSLNNNNNLANGTPTTCNLVFDSGTDAAIGAPWSAGESGKTIVGGRIAGGAKAGFGPRAASGWIVYLYKAGGFKGDPRRRLKMIVNSSGGARYGDPTIAIDETEQTCSVNCNPNTGTWDDGATNRVVYLRATDPRYPASDSAFYWDGSFLESLYWADCAAPLVNNVSMFSQVGTASGGSGNTPNWEYRSGSTLQPLIPVPCDSCPATVPSIQNLMRPYERLLSYNPTDGSSTFLEDPGAAVTSAGGTPLAAALEAAKSYFTQDPLFLTDPLRACRKNSVILITDGFENQGGNVCLAGTDLGSKRIPAFVVNFGSGAGATNNQCIATNSGGRAYNATDEQGLLNALNDIFERIQTTDSFAAASVPTVQSRAEQIAFLASFFPAQKRSIWSGHLRAYLIDPSTGIPPVDPVTGIARQDDPDNPSLDQANPAGDSRRPLWDAGRVLGATDPLAPLAAGAAATVVSPGVSVWPGRRLVYGFASAGRTPETSLPFTDDITEIHWGNLKSDLGVPVNTAAQDLIDFLRGDRDTELRKDIFPELQSGFPSASGDARSYFFQDTPDYPSASVVPPYLHKLGDIFHSDPAMVGPPSSFTYLARDLHGYGSVFALRHAKRRRVLLVGSDDGFIHAFEAGVWGRDTANFPGTWDAGTGREIFGYAPRAALATVKNTFQTFSSIAPYQYSLDGLIGVGDVFTDNFFSGQPDAASRAWHTVAVAGMRQGGHAVFALDVTQADAYNADGTIAGSADAAPACLDGPAACTDGVHPSIEYPRILWELTDAGNPPMGETWSRPIVGRLELFAGPTASPRANNYHSCTADATKGCVDRFVAIFGGGYDAAGNAGRAVYVVDVETGTVLAKLTSGKNGSGATVAFGPVPATPAVVDLNDDGYFDRVYVGEMRGQLWRIDLTPDVTGNTGRGADGASVTYFPFEIFDAAISRPFYMEPTVVLVSSGAGGADTLGIAVGSGNRATLLDNTASPQSFFFVIDAPGNAITRTPADLGNVAGGGTPTASGWRYDYPDATEKTTTEALSEAGYLVFTTFRVNSGDPCSSGLSRLFALSYATGAPPPGQPAYQELGGGAALGISGSVTESGGILVITQEQNGQLDLHAAGQSIHATIRNWKEK